MIRELDIKHGGFMLRRDLSAAIFASAAGSAVVSRRAEAQSCTAPCYAQTSAEITAGVTPVNLSYPCGVVDRYATNTTPGTTNMSTALQSAINVAVAAVGSGHSGIPVRFLASTYLITTPPSFGTATNVQKPLDIGGVGLGTIVVNNAASSTGASFSLVSGVYLHDMVLAGNSAHKNDGVHVDGTTTAVYGWLIERVYSLMPGIGFYLKNTNTGVIRDCWHWRDNAPFMPIPQTVTSSDISHGIYATGGFVHQISIYDFGSACSVNYTSGQRWIKNDATQSLNFSIRGGLPVNESPSNTQKFLELGSVAGTSHIVGAEISGVYHESGYLEFNGMSCSNVYSCTNGGVADADGLGLNFTSNSVANMIGANSEDSAILAFDAASGGNIIMGGNYGSYADTVSPTYAAPNTYMAANRSASKGGLIVNKPAFSSSMTANLVSGKLVLIVASSSTSFSINAPTNPTLGDQLTLTIANTSGGALGTGVFNSVFRLPSATPTMPAAGFQRTWLFYYDGAYWETISMPSADAPYA
jgi:hypothetical protein